MRCENRTMQVIIISDVHKSNYEKMHYVLAQCILILLIRINLENVEQLILCAVQFRIT